ncbi:MAG: hypothetical protein JO297_08060 [Nitrososphaeraceae archaeon]|nr:hypothetical protein [Nitrososphaeraceae archaeon]
MLFKAGFLGFKRILIAYYGMSAVMCDVDDSSLTPLVPWQFPSLLLSHHHEAVHGPLSLDVAFYFHL